MGKYTFREERSFWIWDNGRIECHVLEVETEASRFEKSSSHMQIQLTNPAEADMNFAQAKTFF